MFPGVGYITPPGEKTHWGREINQAVLIPDTPGEVQRAALTNRYGKEWEQGADSMHSTDHRAALEKLWARARAGFSTNGLLKNDGKDHVGKPTITEVYDSYFGLNGAKVLEAAHTVLPGEYGFGKTPFSPADRQEGWTTGFWSLFISPWGAGRTQPKSLKEEIARQVSLIEAGSVPGWEPKAFGGWGRKK
jgi:hypothetical protein